MAQVKNLKGIDIPSFAGGLNTKHGAGGIENNQFADGLNVYLIKGDIAKRKGFERWNGSARINTAYVGMGIFEATFTAGDQIVGVAGSKIAKKGTNAWTDITDTVTITAGNYSLFCMVNNNLVGVNGTDKPWYYTGTGTATELSAGTTITAPTVCAEFHGRLFLAQGRTLFWSDYMAKALKTFPVNNNQTFEANITGMMILGDKNSSVLLVLTTGGTHICIFDPSIGSTVGGSGTFRFDTLSLTDGCVSPCSVKECITPAGVKIVIWADRDGLKGCSSEQQVVKLTENIQPTWDDLNIGQLTNSTATYYRNKYWYFLSCANGSGSTHDRQIIYDLENMAVIAPFDMVISNLGVVLEDGKEILVGSDYTGYWNKYDTGKNDNGVAVDAWFKTKAYDGDLPMHQKAFRTIALYYSWLGSYTYEITLYLDHAVNTYTNSITAEAREGLDLFVLDVDVLGVLEQLVIQNAELRKHGRIAQIKIQNDTLGETFRFHRIIVGFVPVKMRAS